MIDKITTDVYDLTIAELNDGRYRVFLFDGDTPTLVDAGLGDTTDVVVDRLTELGVEPERLVITHGDPDHIGGFSELADYYELETWVPDGVSFETDVAPDNRYGDGDDVGRFTAVHTPGHTPNHHSLSMKRLVLQYLAMPYLALQSGAFQKATSYFRQDIFLLT